MAKFGSISSGERYNKRRPKDQRIELDISHKRLSSGFTGEDKIWRQIVTLLDAERGGCNLVDIDELRFEYGPEEFANLLMCEFIDDTASIFPLAELQRCMVDSWEEWTDVKPFTLRPYGHRPVLVGYDPSLKGDSAGCVVLAAPDVPGGKFRVLERHQWRGLDFAARAEAIRKITERFNVTYIGIDSTGLWQGVLQLVRQFYPGVREFNYSV